MREAIEINIIRTIVAISIRILGQKKDYWYVIAGNTLKIYVKFSGNCVKLLFCIISRQGTNYLPVELEKQSTKVMYETLVKPILF